MTDYVLIQALRDFVRHSKCEYEILAMNNVGRLLWSFIVGSVIGGILI